MIFTSPIVIGAVVGAVSAYFLKGNTIRNGFANKGSAGIFKRKNHQEAIEFEAKEDEMPTYEGKKTEIADEDNVYESAIENVKETVESIQNKSLEVFDITTKKGKETVEVLKKKTEEALEVTTVKVNELTKLIREKTEIAFEETAVKVKDMAELIKEETGKALEKTTEKMKEVIESFKKKYR